MSATISQSQPAGTAPDAKPAVSPAETDVSARVLLLLFLSAALWLVAGSVLGLIASLNFHGPTLFADCAAFSYGRSHPAATNALLYGFAAPAGLGVLLWLAAHLGQTKLTGIPLVILGWLLWNVGVTLGVVGIFLGDNTGHEWLEFPRYASAFLFAGYLPIGLAGLLTFKNRQPGQLQLAQWFILAALFWFPWIFTTASLLLVIWPVRGVMQSVVGWWYMNNFGSVWLVLMGLAVGFAFAPKFAKAPLHSRDMGLFTFWSLILFGSWAGIPAAAPVPSWIPAVSALGSFLMVAAILATFLNLIKTLRQADRKAVRSIPELFIPFGVLAFTVAALMSVISQPIAVSVVTNFTWFVPAQQEMLVYGFFTMTMIGAIYYIAPRLTPVAGADLLLGKASFLLCAVGVLFYVVPLAAGGIIQGSAMNDATVPFLNVVKGSLMAIRGSTLGELLMILGNVIFLLNVILMLFRFLKTSATVFLSGPNKAVGVVA